MRQEPFTTTQGQKNLPRYFMHVFAMLQRLPRGRIEIELPDRRVFCAQGKEAGIEVRVAIKDPDVFARLVREGSLGFSDAYIEGQWSTPDLPAFMALIHDEFDDIYDSFSGAGLVQIYERFLYWLQANSKRQARKNIAYHYDLGNAFYAHWLDGSMTYSSALFEGESESLEVAQERKYARLVEALGLKAGDHILEIGCGWGGFAEYAAGQHGLRLTCLTISQEQYSYARARMERAGLSELVTIKLQDYRDETGVYDGIVSIEMFEAVGEKYWPVYFETLRKCLKPKARAALQIITVRDDRFKKYKESVDFIQKYIFPGGMLPSPSELRRQIAAANLTFVGSHEFGQSYARTLDLWYARFNAPSADGAALDVDAAFARMWNLYLTGCAATFRSGNCDVTQIIVENQTHVPA